jgi:outer membrane protein W
MKAMILAVALGFAALGGAAQAADGKIGFGLQGGAVFTDFSRSNTPVGVNYENRTGYMGGAFVEFGLWTITLRPEANYVVTKYNVGTLAEIKNKYLEIPLLLKINPFADSVVSPFIVLGPSWSKHLGTDVSVLGTTATFNNTNDDDFWSGVAGVGVEFNVAENIGLSFQGRYNFGLSDTDTSTQEVKARSIYGMAGITIQN